jgi:hypothetical protein
MSIAVASSPWSATSPAAAWSVREVSGGQGVEWVLRRNCSLSPRQVLGVYLSLCVVSAVIAAAFWWHGAPAVLWFAGLELSAVGVAWLVYACHATDRETITIERGVVRVEHRCGRRVEQVQLDPTWLRVEPAGACGARPAHAVSAGLGAGTAARGAVEQWTRAVDDRRT